MASNDSSFIPLLAHPHTPGEAVRRLAAQAEAARPDSLRFLYLLEAELEHIRIPAPVAEGGRADQLWAHTCFEAFVAFDESPHYLELNFSPSGQWAAYRFESYRQGMAPAALPAAPRIALRRNASGLELQAEVSLSGTPEAPNSSGKSSADRRLRISLSAVVEDLEGRLSYWALRHPPGRPDFHHPCTVSLALEFPRTPIHEVRHRSPAR
jgi:hypothetical protein